MRIDINFRYELLLVLTGVSSTVDTAHKADNGHIRADP